MKLFVDGDAIVRKPGGRWQWARGASNGRGGQFASKDTIARGLRNEGLTVKDKNTLRTNDTINQMQKKGAVARVFYRTEMTDRNTGDSDTDMEYRVWIVTDTPLSDGGKKAEAKKDELFQLVKPPKFAAFVPINEEINERVGEDEVDELNTWKGVAQFVKSQVVKTKTGNTERLFYQYFTEGDPFRDPDIYTNKGSVQSNVGDFAGTQPQVPLPGPR